MKDAVDDIQCSKPPDSNGFNLCHLLMQEASLAQNSELRHVLVQQSRC